LAVVWLVICSAIFVLKKGSGRANIWLKKGGIKYTNARKKRFRNAVWVLLEKNFWNGVPACLVTKIPLVIQNP
jgi:hypothetical protein